jgi:hypothetical protein
MVNYIPYFAGFITVLFGIAFGLSLNNANKKDKK